MFSFCVKEFEGSAPGLGQRPQHVAIGGRTERTKDKGSRERSGVCPGGFGEDRTDLRTPEAAGEEAAVLHAVPEQLQGQLGVLDVTVGQQQQVPDAPGRRQQTEGLQGPPELGAAPYWNKALARGREALRCCLQGLQNSPGELSHGSELNKAAQPYNHTGSVWGFYPTHSA